MTDKPSALVRAEECLTALLGATRVCVKVDRVDRQVPTDERAPNGQPKSKRIPTEDFVVSLFEGGSIVCTTKQEAQTLAEALTKAIQDVLKPIQRTLIIEVKKAIAGKATIQDEKRAVTAVQAAQRLVDFRYNATEKQTGFIVVPQAGAIATLPGSDHMMNELHTDLNQAIRKVTAPICEKLRTTCDNALAEALES